MLFKPILIKNTQSIIKPNQVFIRLNSTKSKPIPNLFFKISADGKSLGEIQFKLYEKEVPKTSQNFYELCTGLNGYGYKGSKFHRIIPSFMLQERV